ncbi:Uridine diphosphate glucose pyrophosphatase [Sarcoptes scabiei]|nr:Uridine diphosphate glucose pyrophosphatase [Sarcoptes scabiei]
MDNRSIEIVKLESLKDKDSPYVRPYRFHYIQEGKKKTWDYVQSHDCVAILLYNIDRNKLIFVRQFRPPVYLSTLLNQTNASVENIGEKSKDLSPNCGFTIELCAGLIDKNGLSVQEIACEEIFEETGYRVPLDSLKSITTFRTGVGTSGQVQHLFYCPVSDGGGIDDESIEVIEMSVEEAQKLIYANDVVDGVGRPVGLRLAINWFINDRPSNF